MSLLATPIARLDGTPTSIGEITGGRPALLVNVASRCGLTSQYGTLEEIHSTYADRGFTVVGVPCNQFGGQEPGTSAEIAEFCSATYGVTFPMTEKVEVNGPGRHPDLCRAHHDTQRGGRGRRHRMELREVPRRRCRHGSRPLHPRHPARRQAGHRHDRAAHPRELSSGLLAVPASWQLWPRETAVLAPRDGSSGPARRQFRPARGGSGPARNTSCRFAGPQRQFVGPRRQFAGPQLPARGQVWVPRARGSTALAPAERMARAARVIVQPLTTRSSSSSTLR